MSEKMTILSWNVQGEIGVSDRRLQEQLDFLDEHTSDIDLFLFQAVHYEETATDTWAGQLGELLEYFSTRGYHTVHTGDWAQELRNSSLQPHADITGAHNRCNLIASRWPLTRRPLSLRNRGDRKPRNLTYYTTHFPEKILVAELDISAEAALPVDTVETWDVGIINGANWGEEKLNMLETVYGRLYLQTTKTNTPVVLGGDFNAPKHETADGTIISHGKNAGQYTHYPFYGEPYYLRDDDGEVTEFRFDQRWHRAEAHLFDPAVSEWTMQDAYWAAEQTRKAASTEDYTHVIPNASPAKKRLDHILVSEHFTVHRSDLWNGTGSSINGLGPSDHAPVITEVDLK